MGTESRNPKTTHIDAMPVGEILKIMNEENRRSVEAVEKALPEVEKAVLLAVSSLEKGGRLLYAGAGTSGRIAVMDAAECPPTFGVDYETVVAVMAGGESAMFRASENAEDSFPSGAAELLAKNVCANDTVIGISASGNASYVCGALTAAKEKGASTVSLSCNRDCRIAKLADVAIVTETGAEVISGSTRLKAGNAQKMVLNMISTSAMVKTGKVYGNLMINLKPTNEKLKKRMIGIVSEICGTLPEESERLLTEGEWDIRKAAAAHGEGKK